MRAVSHLVVAFGLAATILVSSYPVAAELSVQNTAVVRSINLQTQLAKSRWELTVKPQGGSISKYTFLQTREQENALAHISARCGLNICKIEKDARPAKDGYVSYTVRLNEPTADGKESKITVRAIYNRLLKPFPKEITQKEDQKVTYEDSLHFVSPYETLSEETKVKVASSRIESYTKANPVTAKGSSITYGPYKNVKSFSKDKLSVHFVHNKPFATVTRAVREVEVSHWGNIAFEEEYDLEHTGALLKGGFSRIDYMHGARSASISSVVAKLPADASDVYYRDRIGNVTTSALSYALSHARLELTPRFPLFGGWKTSWYMGFNSRASSFLKHSKNKYKLEIPFVPTLENVLVEEYTLKIILPEGATDVQLSVPLEDVKQSSTKRYTYLDTPVMGRPVLILEGKNVVKEHAVTVTVSYNYDKAYLLHEPLLAVGAFFTMFLVYMIASRVNISITSSEPKKKME